jgi:hypothetical protein
MKSTLKLVMALLATTGLMTFVGCGGGHHSSSSGVTILVYDGHYGYYSGSIWCWYGNNYCGTGLSYGISNDGYYYNNIYYNDWNNDYYYNNGSGNGGYYDNGSGNGGYYDNGSGNGGYYDNGSGNGGYYDNGSGNGGYYDNGSGNGGYYNNGSGNGSYSNNGSGNGYYGAANTASVCTSVDACVAAASDYKLPNSALTASNAGQDMSNPFASQQNGYANSASGATKDVDLQKADAQSAGFEQRAQAVATQFGMAPESARRLTQLADQVQRLSAAGAMTAEDREAITHSALNVAGISSADVNNAIAQVITTGDQKSIDELMNKAAKNLGMSSSAGLRDQLLPALGIKF